MSGWKTPCGIHLVRTRRRDVRVDEPCPYCQAVIAEVRSWDPPRPKFAEPARPRTEAGAAASSRREQCRRANARYRAKKRLEEHAP